MNNQQLFEVLEKQGVVIPTEYKKQISQKIESLLNYEPKIGVFGKTGAGKSSLCNALFGEDVCPISDVAACTREPQEVVLACGSNGIKLVDVPGIGESESRDKEYSALYQNLLPELDLVLWVLKGDDRAFSSDERCYKELVKPYIDTGVPFFMVINQVDKIEPLKEWNVANKRPGTKQAHNIEEKRKAVAGFFSLKLNQIIPVSANEKFGLVELVDSIVNALPNDKKATVLRHVQEDSRSEFAKHKAEDGFAHSVIDILVDLIPHIPKAVKAPAKVIAKALYEPVKDVVVGIFKKLKFW